MAAISAENLGLALGNYLETELVPQSTGLQKVGLYLAIPTLQGKAPEMLKQFMPALSFLDSMNDDGTICLDGLYPKIKEAVHKAGKVPVMGIIFDETDVDKLYSIALKYAKEA